MSHDVTYHDDVKHHRKVKVKVRSWSGQSQVKVRSGQESIFDPDHGKTFDPDHGQNLDPDRGQTFDPDHGPTFDPDHGQTFDPDRGQTFDPDRRQTRVKLCPRTQTTASNYISSMSPEHRADCLIETDPLIGLITVC